MAEPTSHLDDADSTAEYPMLRPGAVRVHVSYGADSHPGRVRANNEDHYLVARLTKALRVGATNLPGHSPRKFSNEEGYIFIVADGMGGAAGGAEASRLAVESVEHFVLNTLHWFLHVGGPGEAALKTELREALRRADLKIFERADETPSLRGMGTTLTLAYTLGDELFVAHAGDSRAYLFREGLLEQVTEDHTLVQMLVSSGQLTEEQARRHPRRNVVTNVVGGPSTGVYAEFHKAKLADGDLLLLCSDGLSESVPAPRIAETLAIHADDPDAAVQRLIEQALEAGAPDNVTVIVARYAVDAG